MPSQNNFWKISKYIFPFADFLYILQLEEYNTRRYFMWLPRFFLRRNIEQRERLKYTPRARMVCIVATTIYAILVIVAFKRIALPIAILSFFVLTVGIPIIVLLGNVLTGPIFVGVHAARRRKAARRIARVRSSMRIIAVAGSYGKTTTKRFIEQLAQHQFRVQLPPGNINTPAGIAYWINTKLDGNTTLLILEADGYSRREYLQTCAMAPADIAVITNIGDQHLERFGSKKGLRDALAEVFLHSRPNAFLIGTDGTFDQLRSFDLGTRSKRIVSSEPQLRYFGVPIEAPNLSSSQKMNLALALQVAEILQLPERFVLDTAAKLSVPERRQQQRELFGYEAIDDSYNISFATASAAIAAGLRAAAHAGKKLLVITAGIPELAPDEQHKNEALGTLLAQSADHTIVLNSMFAGEIVRGLGNAPRIVLPQLSDFEHIKNKFPSNEWLLLLLPELNDLYYG